MSLVIRPAAAADLDEAFLWYEAQRPGLGSEFLNAVEEAFHAVLENPRRYRVVYRDTRRAAMALVEPPNKAMVCLEEA